MAEGALQSAAKRRRAQDLASEDVSERTVADIVATIADPHYMCGPDVRTADTYTRDRENHTSPTHLFKILIKPGCPKRCR